MSKIQRLPEIDVMRAIAIMLILVYHMDNYASVNYLVFTHPYLGRIGVGLFTFISGYSLYHNYSKINGFKDIIKFYRRRILRIFPLYWIAFVIYIPVFWWLGRLSNPTIVDFLATLTGTQILLNPAFVNFNLPVLWYIGLIMLLCLIYPFLILLSNNNKEILINSLSIFVFFVVIRMMFNIIEVRFFLYYFIFISGILIKSIDAQNSEIYRRTSLTLPYIFMIFLFIRERIIPYDANEEVLVREDLIPILFSLCGFLLSFILLNYNLIIYNLRYIGNKILKICKYLAVASYPIYLFHPIVLYPQKKLLYNLIQNNLFYDIIIFLGIIPIFIVLCYYIQIYENIFSYKLNNLINSFKLKIHKEEMKSVGS